MAETPLTIVWFRQDLRLADNPALCAASARGSVLPIYILDDTNAGAWAPGAASRVWLHHSLRALQASLGERLQLFRGDAIEIITELAAACPVNAVFWNRCYEPWRIRRDAEIKSRLATMGIGAQSFNASLLWEPWQVVKADGTPYRVFTPFYQNGCHAAEPPHQPLAKPAEFDIYATAIAPSCSLDQLELLSAHPWQQRLAADWRIGEAAAAARLDAFCATELGGYRQGRDYPAAASTSRLSPHLHFGEISPHQIWYRILHEAQRADGDGASCFLRELGWREFSYYLLYHFPGLPERNFNRRFDNFAWRTDTANLRRWQRGLTGFPIVDAGMRELSQTGYMHNRVRMIVASFLIKNMLLHWRHGENWFWDCLLDADLANNSAGWQWCAGSGADAAPYFRIFNPVLQSEKFDPDGEYILRFCPELAGLPKKLRHQPWQASEAQMAAAGIAQGVDYPAPMLDLKLTRERALAAFKALS